MGKRLQESNRSNEDSAVDFGPWQFGLLWQPHAWLPFRCPEAIENAILQTCSSSSSSKSSSSWRIWLLGIQRTGRSRLPRASCPGCPGDPNNRIRRPSEWVPRNYEQFGRHRSTGCTNPYRRHQTNFGQCVKPSSRWRSPAMIPKRYCQKVEDTITDQQSKLTHQFHQFKKKTV